VGGPCSSFFFSREIYCSLACVLSVPSEDAGMLPAPGEFPLLPQYFFGWRKAVIASQNTVW
jgi:hypothetical protein